MKKQLEEIGNLMSLYDAIDTVLMELEGRATLEALEKRGMSNMAERQKFHGYKTRIVKVMKDKIVKLLDDGKDLE